MAIIVLNSRNQFRGRVARNIRGPVVSEVQLETAAGTISSVVTSSSLQELDLREGHEAMAVFKATEVVLTRFQPLPRDTSTGKERE
ncbi:MAG: TOBE domain-containing protein [Gammaproteobacteria bacterium]|nr:TOBE domain-containing protein [Gammaproteobacteria bacterium]